MISFIEKITKSILDGRDISYTQSLKLINIENNDLISIKALLKGADEIREKYNGNKVDLCSIMNGKSGKCSEDCKFCAQSDYYNTKISEYGLINYEEIYKRAKEMYVKGIDRFSIVTSGKSLTTNEFEEIIKIYSELKENIDLNICASHGVVSYKEAMKLKQSGVNMYHHNIETSENHYKNICTTHSYNERINTIKNIQRAGMEVCCGVIIGMGENIKDRIDMMFEIKKLNVSSIPVNLLNSIKGTPLENLDTLKPMEILKTIAVYRYIVPKAHIRYAGGRNILKDSQVLGLRGGVNAMLVGDYLTTIGSDIENDNKIIKSLDLNY